MAPWYYQSLEYDRIVIHIDSWEVSLQYPNGHFVRSIRPIGDIETETMVILIEHQLATTTFSKACWKVSLVHSGWAGNCSPSLGYPVPFTDESP